MNEKVALENNSRRLVLWRGAGGLIGAAFASLGCSRKETHPYAGIAFPDFSLPDLQGSIHHRTDYLGRPMLVNFWATWCPPCRAEMGDLDILGRRLAPRGLQLLAVSVDDDPFLVAEYVRRERLSLTVLLDVRHRWSDEYLHVPGFPTTYLVSADGVVRTAWVGARPWADAAVQKEVADLAGLTDRL